MRAAWYDRQGPPEEVLQVGERDRPEPGQGEVAVDVAGHTVIEKDANSTMVTNWTVAPAGTGTSVTVKTSWQGAGGVKGFFEKTFAPLGLKKIQSDVLGNLKKQVEGA